MIRPERCAAFVLASLLLTGSAWAGQTGRQQAPTLSDAGTGQTLMAQMMGRAGMGGSTMGRGMMGEGVPQAPSGSTAAQSGAGSRIFTSQCATCHTLRAGARNTVGPNLHGLIGRRAGNVPGYDYSEAMRRAGESGLVWNAQTLDAFLADPHKDIPGEKMPFAGMPDKLQRDEVIHYLAQASK